MDEVVLKVGEPYVETHVGVTGYYVSKVESDDPAEIFGIGTWEKIPAANTVSEVMNPLAYDDFIISGNIHIWKLIL